MQRPGSPLSYSAEKDLRKMLEGKEAETERQRRRKSGLLTKILLIGVLAFAGVIYLYPDPPKNITARPKPLSLPALPAGDSSLPQVFAPVDEDKGMAKELQPFAVKPGQQQANKDDIHFAMELLNFMQPGAREPKPAEPAGPPKVAAKSPAKN